jgi:hypothetical protein
MKEPILDTYNIKYLLVFTTKDGSDYYRSNYGDQLFQELADVDDLENDLGFLSYTLEEAEKELHSEQVEDAVNNHNDEFTSDEIDEGILIVNAKIMEIKVSIQVYEPELSKGQKTLILNKTF